MSLHTDIRSHYNVYPTHQNKSQPTPELVLIMALIGTGWVIKMQFGLLAIITKLQRFYLPKLNYATLG